MLAYLLVVHLSKLERDQTDEKADLQ